jgi:hypothetical protein
MDRSRGCWSVIRPPSPEWRLDLDARKIDVSIGWVMGKQLRMETMCERRGEERRGRKEMIFDVIETHMRQEGELEVGDERRRGSIEGGMRGVRNGLEIYLASAADSGMGEAAGW